MMPCTSMLSTPPSLFSDTSSFSSTTTDTGSPAICCAMPAVAAPAAPGAAGAGSACAAGRAAGRAHYSTNMLNIF